jgi:hypothetical protein
MDIRWNEPSTKRGLVWIITSVVSIFAPSLGTSTETVWAIGGAVAGAMGVTLPDRQIDKVFSRKGD